MEVGESTSFETPKEFCDWLEENQATETELWMKIYKKASGIPTITWTEAVIEAIAWGWIDGIKKSLDKDAYFQRFTPRTKRSAWSKKNCGHAEKLIADGRMQPSGLLGVDAAKADGRWDNAYAGSKDMVIPADFLEALAENKEAEAFYKTLNRTNLFTIYHKLHSAKKPETRKRRIDQILAKLAMCEKFH